MRWESQAAGSWTIKRGVIVAVVPALVEPLRCVPREFAGFRHNFDNWSRDHESYLVQVGKSVRLYRPRVAFLTLDSENASGG